ncbi:hypothetical protein EM59_016450 [Vibrio parahaemolyticus]|uniref:hypothetical protein n=1 Tax=Vibrio parahaemolyticus TaxID=670 RepID=UPI0004D6EC07|nr:hypothetical protein [Vibrio parahaemolyticus]EGQ7650920.1 hypothetical protein [Vibrio parahaemolyticus]EGQ9979472.1 hypothetical protein [Vibrio parahaemolyticus]EJG1824802.1 hypothetical protein [Vibrio parahaemolyticus]ELB2744111.1 hypothetical protein [Vibrio parahaemolyticus]ELC9528610.1 hypothetical protein [Vibrio parahaemolyticus]
MTFSAKEYQEVIQGWLNAVSNGFVSFLATEKKAKRQLFEAVFKVKRSSDNTRVKILAVKSKSRTEKTLNPVKKSGKHGFHRLIA